MWNGGEKGREGGGSFVEEQCWRALMVFMRFMPVVGAGGFGARARSGRDRRIEARGVAPMNERRISSPLMDFSLVLVATCAVPRLRLPLPLPLSVSHSRQGKCLQTYRASRHSVADLTRSDDGAMTHQRQADWGQNLLFAVIL